MGGRKHFAVFERLRDEDVAAVPPALSLLFGEKPENL